MNVRPLFNRILVQPDDKESVTKGGIVIPDSAKEMPITGTVTAVGKGKQMPDGTIQPMTIKPGDRILFAKWGGTELELDGAEIRIMLEEDVYGILE